MNITTNTIGRRTYITGDTYAYRDAIRNIGAHWDADRKSWWTAKKSEAEDLVAKLSKAVSASNDKAPGMEAVVAGRATYRGKDYYVGGRTERGRTHYDDTVNPIVTRDGLKMLLYSKDGSFQFWADEAEVQVGKTYERPTTIKGLRDYAARAAAGTAGTCDECGTSSARLVACSDSSGISGHCCPRCASMSQYERSFG